MHNPAGFVLLTDEKYINDFLEAFKTSDDVNSVNLQKYFSNRIEKDDKTSKITSVSSPLYYTSDEFILRKGTLPNVKEDIQTSIGLYIINLYYVSSIFGENIPYFNPKEGMTPKNISKLQQKIIDLMIEKKASPKQFGIFQRRFAWIGFKNTLWCPGQSYDFVKMNPDVQKAKPELLKKWKEEVENGADPVASYVTMVEGPLKKIAENSLKNNSAWPIYARGGKPAFGNQYKNCTISMGPVYDPITGTYKIAEHSFMEGVDNNMVPLYTNIQVSAAYDRAVQTQDGGAKTKQIFAAMQSVKLNPKRGSDCGSKLYKEFVLTEQNITNNLLRFILDEKTGKLVKLTDENKKEYIGKKVKMRSPLYCKDPEYCNICAGDYFYELGVTNIGNTCTRMSSTILNLSLKSMHDISVNADTIVPFKYIQKI